AMATSIFIAAFIFALFLSAMMFLLAFPLTYALIGAILFILFQYLLGPLIVSASVRLHYLKPGENQWLETTVKTLAEKDEVSIPRLAIVPNKTPNAFVFGRTSRSATLAVHEGLLTSLNKDEVEGVIAHELGHIKHKDYIVMTVLSALPLIAYIVAQSLCRYGMISSYSRRGNRDGNAGLAIVIAGGISFLVYITTFLSVMRLSRLREHYADAYSAYLTGEPNNLQSGLAKITYGLSIIPQKSTQVRAFYIGDPTMAKKEISTLMKNKQEYDLDKDGVLDEVELQRAMEKEAKSTWGNLNNWFSTHPPTFKRILLLREIEKEMETGNYSSKNVYSKI
ncbi:M48 family metalloprotease, partial [Candidatus Bathyarchaeota archaeon]|nr:M48 family metalloprotease [Candidatus Bathyarchaeota archaeon]